MKNRNSRINKDKKRIVVHQKGNPNKTDTKRLDDICIYNVKGSIQINRAAAEDYGVSSGKDVYLKDVDDKVIASGVAIQCSIIPDRSAIQFSGIFIMRYKHQLNEFRNLKLGSDNLKITVNAYTKNTGRNTIPLRATSIESVEDVTNRIQITN